MARIGDITLTASARSNLLSLQNTASLLSGVQSQLSTGKKINSALDGAASYFQSQGFLNTANDLSSLKDSMSTALETITAATDAIDSITSVVEQLQSIVTSALQTTDSSTRESYSTQYNSLLTQLDSLAQDSTFNGTNLVASLSTTLQVNFNTTNTTGLSVSSQDLTSSGLGIGNAQNNWTVGSKAKQVTENVTVQNTNYTATGVYAGTLSVGVSGTITATGVGAQITSNSGSYSDGATVTLNAAASLTAAGANTIGGQLAAAVSAGNLTVTTGTALSTSADFTSTSIKGQFTVTGGTSSTYNTGTNTLTVGADTGSSLVIAAGQSIQVTTNAGTTVYTNSGSSDVSITLSATDTAAAGANNSTAEYSLTGGTVSTTGSTFTTGATFGSSTIVDSGDAALGTSLTTTITSSGTGLDNGTTTSSAASALDLTNATVSTVAASLVTAKVNGTGTAAYTVENKTLTVTGSTQLTGSSTTIVGNSLTIAQNQLSTALSTLRSAAASFGNNSTLVTTRQEYTNNMINTLQDASDSLVLADSNQAGAEMQTLQAQNSLGITSLGISGTLAQAVLKLF